MVTAKLGGKDENNDKTDRKMNRYTDIHAQVNNYNQIWRRENDKTDRQIE